MQAALKNEKIANKLSHQICFHQSEWWIDSAMAYWEPVFKKIGKGKTGKKRVDNLKSRLTNLCRWEEVASKVTGFSVIPNVYHFHPVAFVENMKEMNKEPEWIIVAKGEVGQKEISGLKHNQKILEYHSTTSLGATADETAWCSAFVNWCMGKSGYTGTKSAKAVSWKNWGKKITKPVYGCIVVFDFSYKGIKYNGRGHVGFVVGKDKSSNLFVLGGNQSDSVKVSMFECTAIEKHITYIIPADFEAGIELPEYEGEYDEATFESTR